MDCQSMDRLIDDPDHSTAATAMLICSLIAAAAAGFELLSSIADDNAPAVAADHSTAGVVVADAADREL